MAVDFYVLPLGGCDVVLGTDWLKKLGTIEWNFQELTMEFTISGQKHSLHGLRLKQLCLVELPLRPETYPS
jgi:hypothetical protein